MDDATKLLVWKAVDEVLDAYKDGGFTMDGIPDAGYHLTALAEASGLDMTELLAAYEDEDEEEEEEDEESPPDVGFSDEPNEVYDPTGGKA